MGATAPAFASVGEALEMVRAGLGYLAAADAAQLPAASAASTRGCVAVRLARAVCPTAAPRVIPVRWISQDTAL